MEIAKQRLSPQFLQVLVDQDSVRTSRARDLAIAHAGDEDIPLPLRQLVAGIEGDARYSDRGRPVNHRVAEPLFRERPLPRAGVRATEADERPTVVGASHENIDLVTAVRAILDLPDGARERVFGHPKEGAVTHREDLGPRVR